MESTHFLQIQKNSYPFLCILPMHKNHFMSEESEWNMRAFPLIRYRKRVNTVNTYVKRWITPGQQAETTHIICY